MSEQEKREKVIKAFEFCLMPPSEKEIEDDICSHEDCPYYREYNGGKCISAAVSDALALLKAQEPAFIDLQTTNNKVKYGYCPKCNQILDGIYNKQFCGRCGQAVKWDG